MVRLRRCTFRVSKVAVDGEAPRCACVIRRYAGGLAMHDPCERRRIRLAAPVIPVHSAAGSSAAGKYHGGTGGGGGRVRRQKVVKATTIRDPDIDAHAFWGRPRSDAHGF